jgi:hypothetical protein
MSRAAYAARLIPCHPSAVGFCGQRLYVRVCLLLAFVAVLLLTSAQATGAKRARTDCSGGASSIRAELVDGKFVLSQPATSGCIPANP